MGKKAIIDENPFDEFRKMPHNNHSTHASHTGSSGDDLGSTDEVKVFKDEGDREDEQKSSENLLEEKSSLIDLTESEVSRYRGRGAKKLSKPSNGTKYLTIDSVLTNFLEFFLKKILKFVGFFAECYFVEFTN